MRKYWPLALVAAIAVPFAAGPEPTKSEATQAADEVSTAQSPVVDCDSRIQVVPGRGPERIEGSISAGPVTFAGAKHWRDLPRRDIQPRRGRWVPVKMPLIVDAGPAVTVTILSPVEQARIVIGLDQAPYEVRAGEVALRPCPRSATVAGRRVGAQTPFNGGFLVEGPTCLALRIALGVDPTPVTTRLAVGRNTCRS